MTATRICLLIIFTLLLTCWPIQINCEHEENNVPGSKENEVDSNVNVGTEAAGVSASQANSKSSSSESVKKNSGSKSQLKKSKQASSNENAYHWKISGNDHVLEGPNLPFELTVRIPSALQDQTYSTNDFNTSATALDITDISKHFFLSNGEMNLTEVVQFLISYGSGKKIEVKGLGGSVDVSISFYLQAVFTRTFGSDNVQIHINIALNLLAHLRDLLKSILTDKLVIYSKDQLADHIAAAIIKYIRTMPDLLANFVNANQTNARFISNEQKQLCAIVPGDVGDIMQQHPYLTDQLLDGIVGKFLYGVLKSVDNLLKGVVHTLDHLLLGGGHGDGGLLNSGGLLSGGGLLGGLLGRRRGGEGLGVDQEGAISNQNAISSDSQSQGSASSRGGGLLGGLLGHRRGGEGLGVDQKDVVSNQNTISSDSQSQEPASSSNQRSNSSQLQGSRSRKNKTSTSSQNQGSRSSQYQGSESNLDHGSSSNQHQGSGSNQDTGYGFREVGSRKSQESGSHKKFRSQTEKGFSVGDFGGGSDGNFPSSLVLKNGYLVLRHTEEKERIEKFRTITETYAKLPIDYIKKNAKGGHITNQDVANIIRNAQNSSGNIANIVENEKNPSENNANIVENEKKPSENNANIVETETNPSENDAYIVENEKIPSENNANIVETETNPSENNANIVENAQNPSTNDANIAENVPNPSENNTNIAEDSPESNANIVGNTQTASEKIENAKIRSGGYGRKKSVLDNI